MSKLGSMISRYQKRHRLGRQWRPTTKRIRKKQEKKSQLAYLDRHAVACFAFLNATERSVTVGPKKGRSSNSP